jgi:hypothetical protein
MCREAEREGLNRAFVPRPTGDACASSKIACGDFVEPPFPYLRFESPLRGCHVRLNENNNKFTIARVSLLDDLSPAWRRPGDRHEVARQ